MIVGSCIKPKGLAKAHFEALLSLIDTKVGAQRLSG
jgi:hypothetical protein